MAVADAASLRTVAVQLRSLSADPDSQPIIAREEGCLRALVSFVGSEDFEVARIAVGALKNLSSHPGNYDLLRSEYGFLDTLRDFVKSRADQEVRQQAFAILEELTDSDNDGEMDVLDFLEAVSGLREKETPTETETMKPLRTVRLGIPGISDEVACTRVEQLLVRKNGVISVVFEIGAEVALVFTRLPGADLAQFLSTMTGSKVEELPQQPMEGGPEKENEDQEPGYLDRNGQLVRNCASTNAKPNTISQGASSLHERLRIQREEESRRKARASRLMSSIGRGLNSGWGLW